MTSSPESNSARLGHTLHHRAHAFMEGWHANEEPWQRDSASALYEDLEQLAGLATEQGANATAESALELAAYLCSFIDNATSPNPAQRQVLTRLISDLGATLAEQTTRREQHQSSDSDATRAQVCYLCREERELPGLVAQLRRTHFVVRSFREPAQLLSALSELSPDVLLVDETFVDCVHQLVAAVQSQRPAHRDSLLCVVLAETTDATRTLFAQRAGAEAVVTQRDPVAVVAHLHTVRAMRRALGYRVLIVEDDRGQAKFCESILHQRGVITSVCADATRVFEVLAEFKPELVLLDLYLPGSNGIQIAKRIREQPEHAFLPIVFLSGEQDIDQRFEAIRVGADDFITKPVKPGHLVTTVESRIKRARELSVGQSESRALQLAYAELERRVEERARELRARNVELEIAYAKLSNAQEQAIQSEKLASIGQLAAGVAHEINNPIAYVSSNLNALQGYVSQLIGAIDAYGVAFSSAGELTTAVAVEEIRRRFDIDFLVGDFPQLLTESLEGIGRVRKIIRDLKDFSRRDRSESWVRVDISEGLESTLNIVLNQLKYKAQIIKTFADLPLVECLPSELNQVFLNVLMNAGQAIKERGEITVTTGQSGDRVWIAVGDNGEGIPEDVLPRIFDPFFTTKPVGSGTGLGLSISYGIIAKHHGNIEVTSVTGQGTLMRIELPIQQPKDAA